MTIAQVVIQSEGEGGSVRDDAFGGLTFFLSFGYGDLTCVCLVFFFAFSSSLNAHVFGLLVLT